MLVIIALVGCDDAIEHSFIIDFYPDATDPGSKTVSLNRIDSDPDELVVAVDANDITSGAIHSVAFDMTFDPALFKYKTYEIGEFLERSGTVSYMVSTDSQNAGRLIVGVSLLGSQNAVSGSGVFVYLHFEPLTFGSCSLLFENASVRDGSGFGGQPLTGISWYGGFAQVSK